MNSIIYNLAPLLKLISRYLLIFATFTPGTLAKSQEQVLDTSYPILIEEDTKTSSSFGYTVSLAKGTREYPNQPTGWVFIGAPKSEVPNQIRYGDGSNGDDDKEAGVVWRCSLGHSNNNDNCKLMNIDPIPNTSNKKRPSSGSPAFENHNQSFIGGSMELKNNRLVTCGFGWKRGKNKFFNGICYWFGSNISVSGRSVFNQEDISNLVDRRSYDHRLMPFFQGGSFNDQPDPTFQYYSGGEITSGREWQTSQAGISVNLFVDGNDGSSSNLLIGAPGVREWSGAVVLYRNSNNPKEEMARLNRKRGDPTFSEFVVLNRGKIPMESDKGAVKYRWNEYFGYSVSSGKYFRKDKVLYVAGAPRAGRKGSVTIFEEPPYNKSGGETYKRQVKEIQEITVPSKQTKNSFGSYFGSVLYTVDFDGNELDELVVGAPMYSFTEQNSLAGDHGCVFIYCKSKNGIDKMVMSQVLVGSKSPKARFGSAISSIVFDYRNGTRHSIHLVIGAPFEQSNGMDEGSTGAIYLYKSLANGTLDSVYSQRIVASQFGQQIKAFGTSISNTEDIDNNKTPDLAIGAFESSHAIILRTRPKINIQGTLQFQAETNGKINLIQEIKRGSTEFSLITCFTIEEVLGIVQNPIEIWVKISFADNRIKFSNQLKSISELIYRDSQVDPQSGLSTCKTFQISAINKQYGFGYGSSSDDSTYQDDDFQPPLSFYQEVWFNGTNQKSQTISKLSASQNTKFSYDFSSFHPKLPTAQHSKNEEKISISLSECSGKVCRPDIQMTWSFFYPSLQGEDEDEERIKTPKYNLSEYRLGQSRKEIVMQLSILNRNETTLLKSVHIEWNLKNVKESSTLGDRWFKDVCQGYLCPFPHYVRKDRNATLIQIYLDMDHIFVDSVKSLHFTVNARLNFNDSSYIDPIEASGKLRVLVPKTMALVSGSKNSEEILRAAAGYNVSEGVTMKSVKTLYAPFQQRFTIEVQGASVNEVLAEFKIPVVPNTVVDSSPYFLVNFPQTSSSPGNNKAFESIECGDTPFSKSPYKLARVGNITVVIFPTVRKRRQISEENQTVASPTVNTTNVTAERPSVIAEDSGPPTFHKTPALIYPEGSLKFDCNSSETGCIEVTCKIINVRAKRHFHVVFDIYPVKKEIDKLLKESGKNTIFLESIGIVAIFPGNKGTTTPGGDIVHYTDTNLAQTILKSIDTTPVQLWIYIAAGFGGLLVLVLITVGLYYCGFFKREKRQELNKLRADHHRKSMAAAAAMRTSMMIQSSGMSDGVIGGLASGDPTSGSESRENLTEAEFHNEDMEDEKDDNKQKKGKGKAEKNE